MKKIIGFAGSNSKESINKQLAGYALNKLSTLNVQLLDLNDFELPLYGIDYENEHGIPENAHKFLELVRTTDGIILSLAEHNGSYSVAFKNLFDWMSRIDGKLWSNKPMLLMSASPGGRGGKSVLETANARFPFMGGNIVAEFSLPFFGKNFINNKIQDELINKKFHEVINLFQEHL